MNYEGMEAGWYADAASSFEDRGSLAPDEQALQDFPDFTAAEQQDPPPALSGSLADADVIRRAIQLQREQAKSSLPKQVWEMPGPLSYPWEVKRKLEISGMPSVLAADPYVPEVPQPIQAVRPAIRKLLRRLPVERDEEDARVHALKRFKYMVLFDLEATQLGMSLANLADLLKRSFSDAFRTKPTSTLTKRCDQSSAGSLEAESDDGGQADRLPFSEPVDERDVFVHRLSGVAHCLKHGDRKEFFCGRVASKMYMQFRKSGAAGQDPDCCIQCHRARDRV